MEPAPEIQPPDDPPDVAAQQHAQRAGRALIGWMAPDAAALTLNGRTAVGTPSIEQLARARAARDAVEARPPGVDQTGLTTDAPPEVVQHVADLRGQPHALPFFAEGWDVCLVDLTRVCAAQSHVTTDGIDARVSGADPDDMGALAAITLPMAAPVALPAQHDPVQKAWIICSQNPNLRVGQPFSGEVAPGAAGFGFGVSLSPSCVQVASLGGRYFLRDGYHRSVGFLRRGISVVPAFVRNFASIEELGLPAGLLTQDAYLGERPPVLPDFLDDDVASDVSVPATRKMILVQAIEINPMA